MAGVVVRDSGPVCASCAQPVDPRAFVCLNCGAPLQEPVSTIPPPPGLGVQPPPAPPAFSSAPPPPPPPPAVDPLPAPSWDRPVQHSTDSFTFHVPSPADPLPPAPPVFPEAADVEADDRTVVVNRKPKAEWGLRLASGELVPVDGPLLLGRNPAPMAGPIGARRVTIADPGRTVSRSHLVVLPQPGAGIVLRDVSSANGIVLVAPDGSESEIESGGEVRIADRCTILLGTVEIGIEPL
ncbi:MAG TPA: FHA domain-containing protein [Microbacteriaceae bacterium]|nr:FHA domain-containing protein [Microbacteriaceae bacterium]